MLKCLVVAFGVVCCLIALAHIAIGPASIPRSVPVNATMDNEDRFYATLFLGFGLAVAWCGQNLETRGRVFYALLGVFFVGGIARIISIVMVGWPNLLFVCLTVVELLLPPAFWAWHRAIWHPLRSR